METRLRAALPIVLFAIAVGVYAVAAWRVPPGFFEGFQPQLPYRWVSPPPSLAKGNQPPLPGHGLLKVGANGAVDPGSVFTPESLAPQASLSVQPASFPAPPDGSPVAIDIEPVAQYPSTAGLTCETNVYLIKSSQSLLKEALVTLRFSDAVPAPSDIYRASDSTATWTKIGSTGASAPFYISARTTQLGYFAACFPAAAASASTGLRVGGGQTLPILVAASIVIVILGGVPLLLRRRAATGSD